MALIRACKKEGTILPNSLTFTLTGTDSTNYPKLNLPNGLLDLYSQIDIVRTSGNSTVKVDNDIITLPYTAQLVDGNDILVSISQSGASTVLEITLS